MQKLCKHRPGVLRRIGEDDHKDDVDTDAILRVQELVGRNVKLLQALIPARCCSTAPGPFVLQIKSAGRRCRSSYRMPRLSPSRKVT